MQKLIIIIPGVNRVLDIFIDKPPIVKPIKSSAPHADLRDAAVD